MDQSKTAGTLLVVGAGALWGMMGIFVRYFNKPRICDYLRITIGTDEQMECFLKEVKAILQQ